MKRFVGLTAAQAMELALQEEREVAFHPETEDELAFVEISTTQGNGCALFVEEGKVVDFQFQDWS